MECLLEGGSAALLHFKREMMCGWSSAARGLDDVPKGGDIYGGVKLLFVHIFETISPAGKRTAMCGCLLRRAECNMGMDSA